MKSILILLFTLTVSVCKSQSLPFDFEGDITAENFVDFDGGTASVIQNPYPTGINTSETVAQIVREGGTLWSGSKVELVSNLDFTTKNSISMKVYTTAPVGTIVKFKLEGTGNPVERDVVTTVTGEWEELTWDFTGTPSDLNTLVFMFDFGNIGDGSTNSTFLFDDISQLFGGFQIELPVTFEATDINYTMTDFGGNQSTRVVDPSNENNHVIQSIKTNQAATWAGTTIGTNGGFMNDIPLTLENSIISVRVWSPEAGIPIRLKVEDSNDPTHTCETETLTTVSEEWEVMTFDFATEAPGTAALEFGLTNGWSYNMASIFFNFGTEGASVGEQTYYFDDVYFGEIITSTSDIEASDIVVFPNPTSIGVWNIESNNEIIFFKLSNLYGKTILSLFPKDKTITVNAESILPGIYVATVETTDGIQSLKLLKK